MKKYQCLFFIIAAMSSLCYGMQDSTFETNGVKWKKDPYGNVLPNVLDIPAHEIVHNLRRFIASLKDQESGNAFIVQLPHEQSDRAVALFQAGFTPHFADAAKTEWVIKNGSPMPEAATAAAGARVLILRGDEVLVIEDKNIKGRVMFPGGSVDKAELALGAAVREISEEVGLKIRPNDLQNSSYQPCAC